MKSILITDSGINKTSGGGIVSLNLLEALQSCTTVEYVFSSQKFEYKKIPSYNIDAYSINPTHYGYQNNDPFLIDYLSFHFLKNMQVDLVQTYGCPFGLTVEETKRSFKSKVVCDLAPHNIDISREEHIQFAGSYPFPHLNDEMLWGLYSRHLRLADEIVVHSNVSAEYIQKKARLSHPPKVIPHGCYLPTSIPPYPEKFTPGYFGSCGFDKGIIYLVNAWLQCPYPDKLIIGGNEANLRLKDEYLQRFTITGYYENLSDFYKQISIYIQPSVVEGFGITPLEAMAYGRPVIVAKGAGMHELITDGKEGFIVPIREVKDIRDKIMYFHDNPGEIQRMGAEARKTAERYTWDIIKSKYASLYKEILG